MTTTKTPAKIDYMPKVNLKLVHKEQLIPKVFFLAFASDVHLGYIAGQFFSIQVEPKVYRSYSVCYVGRKAPNFYKVGLDLPDLETGEYICFMISTKPGGTASNYFDHIEVGRQLTGVGPAGNFKLKENPLEKVFVATGTGLAPFIPMISTLLEANPTTKIDLFFGSWTLADSFAVNFFYKYLDNSDFPVVASNPKYPNFKIYHVAEDLQGNSETDTIFGGRVTTVIPKVVKDLNSKEFYLCGHPAMVSAMVEVLLNEGVSAEKIVMEKFGK